MGIALWIGSGGAAFLVARFVPLLRAPQWLRELAAAVGTAFAGGVIATAFDFGGWRELDWRAAAFAFFLALAAGGLMRALRARRAQGL